MKHTPIDYVILCAVISVSVFVFSLVSDSLVNIGRQQVALVSEMGASIKETPTNKLAAALRDRSNQLDVREKILSEREQVLLKEKEAVENRVRNILILTISLALVTLFITNLYIYKRDKTKFNLKQNLFGHSLIHTPKQSYRVDLHNIK